VRMEELFNVIEIERRRSTLSVLVLVRVMLSREGEQFDEKCL